jgi:uncharacterized protein YkwD
MTTPVAQHLHDTFIPHERNGYRPHVLHHAALRVYAMVAILVKVFAILIVSTYPAPSSTSNVTPSALTQLTNMERTRAGLRLLTTNSLLTKGAQGKAQDMATKGYFAHTSPTKVTPWYWFQRAGYKYSYAGENLAKDFVTAEEMVAGWMASPSHRKNILNSRFKETGVAVAEGEINGFNSLVSVQFFGEPLVKKTTVVQKPQPKPVVPKTPSPQVVQEQTKPKVLAEETAPTPPLAPAITAPADGDVYTDGQLWIAGTAPKNILVNVLVNDAARVSIRSDEQGNFRVQLPEALTDGRYTLTAQAVDSASGLTSSLSKASGVVVDATPPVIDADHVIFLPSILSGQLDIALPISGETNLAKVQIGSMETTLIRSGDNFHGVIDARQLSPDATQVSVTAVDPAGNSTTAVVADVASVTSNVAEPARSSLVQSVLQVVLFSQHFLMWLLLFLTAALFLKIFVRIRFQHHPTILYTLLLMYAVTVLLLV